MPKLTLKHYFLEEKERIEMEEELIRILEKDKEDILSLDDDTLFKLYTKSFDESPVFSQSQSRTSSC